MRFQIKTGLILFIAAFALFACSPTTGSIDTDPVVSEPEVAVEPVAEVIEEENVVEEVVEEAEEIVEEVMEEEAEAETEEMAEVEEEVNEAEMVEEADMAEEVAFTISTGDSSVEWYGAKAVGNNHTGLIDISNGSLLLAGDKLVSGEFTIDMESIVATDGAPGRLIDHLKSDDFFSVATFPTAELVINSAESLGDDQYAVSGDMTIKGITNPIDFIATASQTDGVINATADIVFDRAQYDVRFGSGSFFNDLGDDLINDEIELTVNLVAMHGESEGAMAAPEAVSGEAEEAVMAEEVVYVASTADSSVEWYGAKAVGNNHTGLINISEGSLVLTGGELVSGQFTIDMESIVATDGAPGRLIDHLKSDDFFSVATFPTAELVINSAESLGDGQYAVTGDLTIKGITNPIEFDATATKSDGQVSATADIVFDRAMYDVRFGSGSFFNDLGDDLINDEIEISVNLVANQ